MADNAITHLVVVGSSAGGIGALSGLVSSLPQDFDAPIVVAQHLDPKRESHLQEILARKSPLPVKTVAEHEPLQAGVVFVVPANRHVNITDSEIDLSSEPASGQPMPSINLLMESAAEVFGENLIAIVLSGTGTDGTEGARTVSQAGGTVIIQDPETAEFGEMPRSLAPSTVDIVTSLEEIGPVLKNLILGIVVPEDCSEDEGRDLEHFLEVLHRNRGVDFRSYKRPTILRRLGRRMTTSDDLQARATELQELALSREEERRLTEEGRRSAEGFVDQLQNQRSLFEAILENISDAGLAVDTEGQVLFSNQVFEETFGEHTGAEAGPLGSTEVLDESGEKLLREATLSSRAARGESFAMRFAVRGRNGALRPFEARCRPIEGDGVTGACSSSAR